MPERARCPAAGPGAAGAWRTLSMFHVLSNKITNGSRDGAPSSRACQTVLDERSVFTLRELCRACGVHAERV